jgi:4-amino-4-deoxy-L-arabinose transferase-like glycosyltransferase
MLSQTVLPGYILPILPPLALLVGFRWEYLLSRDKVKKTLWLGIIVQVVVALVFAAALFIFRTRLPSGYEHSAIVLFLLPLSLFLGALAIWLIYHVRQSIEPFFEVTFITFYFVWVLFLILLIPAMEQQKPVKYLTEDLERVIAPGDIVIDHIKDNFSAPFYTGRHIVFIRSEASFAKMWRKPTRILAMVKNRSLNYLDEHQIPYTIVAKYGTGYLIINQPHKSQTVSPNTKKL